MADYCGITRTNYFRVTNPEKLRDIVERINWNSVSKPDFFVEEDGQYAFGAYSFICGLKPEYDSSTKDYSDEDEYDDEDEYEAEAVYGELQKIVAPGSAIIITEIGHENLRYLNAVSIIITPDTIKSKNLRSQSLAFAQALLGNPAYNPRMGY